MGMQEIGDFKYPSRRPVALLILVVIAGVIAFRWHKAGNKTGIGGEKAHWSCVSTGKVTVPKEPVKVTEGAKKDVPATPVPASPAARTNRVAPAAPLLLPVTNLTSALQEAIALEDGKSLVQARKKYLDILKKPVDARVREDLERRLGRINCQLVMTPEPMPEKQEYVVQRGDSIEKIAKKFGTTRELIEKSNMLTDANSIRLGDRFLVLKAQFSIEVSKSRIDLVLNMNGEFFKRYPVGTGKMGKTPVGTFIVDKKIPEPPWDKPGGKRIPFGDKENILGTRWMSLKATGNTPDVRGYGIHGTWDDASIGKAESMGCVRMKNSDVEELFILLPCGTPVVITE